VTTWVIVGVSGVATLALKAVGPILLGGKPLPQRLNAVVGLLGPALLAALVAIGTLGEGRRLVVDERLLGVGAAALAIKLKAPVLVVVVVAAAVTGVARSLIG
jgi:branched-subunit amino acid transport protein